MSPELIGILSVGVALGLLLVALIRSTNARIERSEDRFQRMAPRMDQRFQGKETWLDERFRQTDERFGRIQALMNDRFRRLEGLFNARFERLEDRFEKLDARQYEMAQALARIEARQINAATTSESKEQPKFFQEGTAAGRTN